MVTPRRQTSHQIAGKSRIRGSGHASFHAERELRKIKLTELERQEIWQFCGIRRSIQSYIMTHFRRVKKKKKKGKKEEAFDSPGFSGSR